MKVELDATVRDGAEPQKTPESVAATLYKQMSILWAGLRRLLFTSSLEFNHHGKQCHQSERPPTPTLRLSSTQ